MASTGEAWRLGRRVSSEQTLAARFDSRANAIGFLRLALALTVVVSHTWPVGGYGTDPGRADNNLGILAVEGFFALSGFLITRSAQRTRSVGRFLWHRCLRIFPGFWVSLLIVAVLLAPLTAMATGQNATGAPGFVLHNALLHIGQTTIGTTLGRNPFPGMWNGPLYTLLFEFECYLLVALLAATGLLRRPGPVIILTAVTWAWLHVAANVATVDDRQARFTLAFLVGAVMYLLADHLPASGRATSIAVVIAAGTYVLGGFTEVGIIALAYAVVCAATLLPFHRVGVDTDLSYGVYIYAWPAQQLLWLAGLAALPLPVYLGSVLVVVLPAAWLSWWLIEKPAQRYKLAALRRSRGSATTATATA